jgi:uncharacterized protein YabN with tetrapyrrole methylase and pyrophosphatase domain
MIDVEMNGLKELLAVEFDARKFGFEWPHEEMILQQAISECDEIRDAIKQQESKARVQEEIGDLIHTAISLCVFAGFDPEETLAKTAKKFSERMYALKAVTSEHGLKSLHNKSTEFMLQLWQEAKIRCK